MDPTEPLEPPVSSPTPPKAHADAANRAWRTFLWGLLVDVGVVVLPVLYGAVSGWDGAGGPGYWQVVLLSVAKTLVTAVISYVMRFLAVPPGNRPAAD